MGVRAEGHQAVGVEAPLGHERLAVVLAAATAVCVWASAFVAIRYAGRHFQPGPLALGRLVVGSLALGAIALARREPLAPRSALVGIAVCGVLWFGLYNVALNAAEQRLDAGIAALLVNVGPIFIAIAAGFLLKEGFPRLLFVGCLVAFAGVTIIGLSGARHGAGAGWGALLCLVAALGYAGGVVAQKPALGKTSALTVTWMACAIGALSCLPYAPQLVTELSSAPASQAGWVIYLGAVPTALGFSCWAYALSFSSAGRMGATTYLVPPLALLLGWAFLGEVPPLAALPGGLLALAGVALARRRAS